MFSPYTIKTYMLLTGAVVLCLHPMVLPACIYLLLIYTSPEAMYPKYGGLWGDDLTPLRMGERRQKVLALFSSLQLGRVAFEHPRDDFPLWYVRAGLSYILAAQQVDLLNTNFTETGDVRIYEEYVRYFNSQATLEQFESACQSCGVRYMVAFSDDFRTLMRARSYRELGSLSKLGFSPGRNGGTIDLTVFELPWNVSRISPQADLVISDNSIQFTGEPKVTYKLAYSYYPGWKAVQNGKRLPIKDARPGMMICPPKAGPVTVRYSYWHYWLRDPRPQ